MKLSFATYRTEFDYFTLIFDLVRHSLKELGEAGFRRFMEDVRRPQEAQVAKIIESLGTGPEDTAIAGDVKRHHRRKMSSQFPVTPTLKWSEYKGHAYLGLNASEIIIRIALFEAFLKEIHRHALMDKPQLLAVNKPNRPIPLKDIFRSGVKSFEMNEIDRQVREVDRLPTKQRAKFFARRLKLPWAAEADITKIVEITELRHSLIHKSPGCPVTDRIIKGTRKLLLSVPQKCFSSAAQLYTSQFAK